MKCAVLAGPTLSESAKGRPQWKWKVERTIGDSTETTEVDAAGSHLTKASARAVAKLLIENAIGAGYEVHARFVEQTGYAQSAVYHPDGRMTHVKYHTPKDGLLGPRCFELPFTAAERKVRAAQLRPRKGAKPAAPEKPARKPVRKPVDKPKPATKPPPKPRTPTAKPPPKPATKPPPKPRQPRQPKPAKAPEAAIEFFALSTPSEGAAWLRDHKPVYLAQVVRWVSKHGTPAQQSFLDQARALHAQPARPATHREPSVRPPSQPRLPTTGQRQRTATPVHVAEPDPLEPPRPRTAPPAPAPEPPGGDAGAAMMAAWLQQSMAALQNAAKD